MRFDIRDTRDERTDCQTVGNESKRYRQSGSFQLEFIEKVWIVIWWKRATWPTKVESL